MCQPCLFIFLKIIGFVETFIKSDKFLIEIHMKKTAILWKLHLGVNYASQRKAPWLELILNRVYNYLYFPVEYNQYNLQL